MHRPTSISLTIAIACFAGVACRKADGGSTDPGAQPVVADPSGDPASDPAPGGDAGDAAEGGTATDAPGDACVIACTESHQMQAVSIEQIEADCRADCASGKSTP